MSIWIDILNLGASGKADDARQMLEVDLRKALRHYSESAEGSREYFGPVPQAVRRFISKLPANEKALARFHEQDLVDNIVDDVVTAIRRTLLLVEFVGLNPDATIDDLVEFFPWDGGLKRDAEWKKKRIITYLRSMLSAGIPLEVKAELPDDGADLYNFDELAFAGSNQRIDNSWADFKRQQDLDGYYFSIDDTDPRSGVDAESVDYGTITMAKVVLGSEPGVDTELVLSLHLLGKSLTVELTSLVDELHTGKPKHGFRPIAWHNVFWCMQSDYEGLHMSLKVLDPYCAHDNELSEHLSDNYRDINSASRPVINRRRRTLHEACANAVILRVREEFAT
jgi:hypothetical protein